MMSTTNQAVRRRARACTHVQYIDHSDIIDETTTGNEVRGNMMARKYRPNLSPTYLKPGQPQMSTPLQNFVK